MALPSEGIRFNAICPGFTESAMTAPILEAIAQFGVPLIEAPTVAAAVVTLLTDSDASGECWYVQPGRPAEAFGFRGFRARGRSASLDALGVRGARGLARGAAHAHAVGDMRGGARSMRCGRSGCPAPCAWPWACAVLSWPRGLALGLGTTGTVTDGAGCW